MKLKLVKQGEFLGTRCDFYVDDNGKVYMSRTQIGYALQYKNPSDGIRNIHVRHYKRLDDMSIEVTTAQIERVSKHQSSDKLTFMYSEKGIYEICRHSNQSVADSFYDWVYETISTIRANGYYIATESDQKWIGARNESKQARRYETDQIKLFVEYAKWLGSRNADRYYVLFTKLVDKKLLIESGQRDNLSQEKLMELRSLETVVKMKIKNLMEQKISYKEIYRDVKKMVEEL